MNFQNLNFDYVEQPRPYPQHVAESRLPRTPSYHSDSTLRPLVEHHSPDLDYASSQPASPSFPATVIPYPSSSSSSSSTTDLYGPDRHQLFGPPISRPNPNYSAPRLPPLPRTAFENLVPHYAMDPSADLQERMNADMLTGFRDPLAREAGVVTPGVDDTPYIQYAIEALTRDRDTGYSGNDSLSSSETISPPSRVIPDQGLGYYRPYQPTPVAEQQQHQTYDDAPQIYTPPPSGRLPQNQIREPADRVDNTTVPNTRPREAQQPKQDESFPPQNQGVVWNTGSVPITKGKWGAARPDEAMPVDGDIITDEKNSYGLRRLSYKPWLLQPASFITLLLLCVLMVAALILCAIFSATNNGFVAYAHSGGQYFLFRILPQLLAAIIVVYTQCIVTTMFRILPFVRLASSKPEERERSIYMDLYPRSTLWPQLIDRWEMWMFVFVAWLINLTLPLQSSLFTVILVDGTWRWGTVQGVVWTLVAMYIVLIVSAIIALVEWAKTNHTGLMWDPRSLADIIMMLSDTNVAAQYRGTELASHRSTIGFALRHRNVEQLGYWSRTDGRDGLIYAIRSRPADNPRGFESAPEKAHLPHDGGDDYVYDTHARDLEASAPRHGHLPWCLRTSQLTLAVVAAAVLFVALLVVSFLPATRITAHGFAPGLASHPGPGAFSPADFLYSFLPSLLGLVLHLLFQSLDLALRVRQPWAALAKGGTFPAVSTAGNGGGAPAARSLLADYAACPWPPLAALRAARNGHYRVAALSAASALFVFLPVLAGGVFMAMTDPASGRVRVYPSVPAYAVVLALLALYLLALLALLPGRAPFRALPHGATCLAEVVGFLVNEELRAEGCFKDVRTRAEMVRKMGLGRADDRWVFGAAEGETLGVRRARRFTEKRKVRKSQIRRGGGVGGV